MTPVRISIHQVYAYCLEPIGPAMVPMSFASRSHGSSQVLLHPRCAQRAFVGARVPFDIPDMTVDVPTSPLTGTHHRLTVPNQQRTRADGDLVHRQGA